MPSLTQVGTGSDLIASIFFSLGLIPSSLIAKPRQFVSRTEQLFIEVMITTNSPRLFADSIWDVQYIYHFQFKKTTFLKFQL